MLNPPYDHYAVWHEHAFPPDGDSFPSTDLYEINYAKRYDAIEDRLGRIFVWHVGSQQPVAICIDRETAIACAKALAKTP